MNRALMVTLKHAPCINWIKKKPTAEVNTNHWFTDGTQHGLQGLSFLIQL